MASSAVAQINVQGETTLSISSANEPANRNCARCGGLLVRHICMDLYSTGTELEIPARRCVQCGDILDPVILRNRRIQHETSMEHPAEAKLLSREIHVAA